MFANQLLHFPNMKKLLFLIPLTALVVACSGGSTNSDREAAIADSIMMAKADSIASVRADSIARAKADSIANAKKIADTFETSLGKMNKSKVLQLSYQQGCHNATMFGDKTIACYNPEWRTEEKFKLFFKNNFGVPSSPEAKQVYNEAYQQYVKGWDDSVNF